MSTKSKKYNSEKVEFNPNLSNQYLYKPNIKVEHRTDDEVIDLDLDLDAGFDGLGERIENCMTMTMEAFPCFDFQYPSTALSKKPDFDNAYEQLWSKYNVHEKKAGLYVHIPFCRSKCSFCYFTVAANRGEDEVDLYLDALEKEMRIVSEHVQDREIESVYIGGGTPTYLSARQLERLFKMIYKHYNLDSCIEMTIESTPTLAELDKLKVMKEYGVTRLSMGIQTTHDHLLKKLNRSFERKDIDKVIEQARSVGIENINLDFMYALPDQTIDDWFSSLQYAFAQDIPGITIYSLDLHESTQFFRKRDELILPDLNTQLRMYDEAVDMLDVNGYKKINSSIFAREKSCYTQQNRRWENLPLIAVGPGAQSYSPGYAYRNMPSLKMYIDRINSDKSILDKYTLVEDEQEYYREAVSMIRFAQLEKPAFEARYGKSINENFDYLIKTLIDLDYMEETDEEIRLTRRGLHRANMISMFLYSDEVKQKLVDHLYTAHAPQMQALRSVGLTEQCNLR